MKCYPSLKTGFKIFLIWDGWGNLFIDFEQRQETGELGIWWTRPLEFVQIWGFELKESQRLCTMIRLQKIHYTNVFRLSEIQTSWYLVWECFLTELHAGNRDDIMSNEIILQSVSIVDNKSQHGQLRRFDLELHDVIPFWVETWKRKG